MLVSPASGFMWFVRKDTGTDAAPVASTQTHPATSSPSRTKRCRPQKDGAAPGLAVKGRPSCSGPPPPKAGTEPRETCPELPGCPGALPRVPRGRDPGARRRPLPLPSSPRRSPTRARPLGLPVVWLRLECSGLHRQ